MNIDYLKISMSCVYKEEAYDVKIELVQEQCQQLKMKFLLCYNMKIVI